MRAALPTAKADYPTKLVRMIEPFGPGSGPEVVATAVGRKLAELWGQPVTVENHPGAGSTAAPAMVATSPADGYTLLVHTNAHAYSAALVTNLPYDPLRDFVAVAALTTQSYVLVAGETTGLATVGALIAAATAKPGQLRFGSTGVGTGTHLGIEKFNLAAGISATHVPARGSDAIADTLENLIAGRTDYALSPIPTTLPHIRAGRLLPLGLSSARRSSALPDVPTVAEAGVPGFDFPFWYGIWAPRATPAASRSDARRGHRARPVRSRRARLAPETRWRTDEHDAARLQAVCAARERKRCPDHRSRRDLYRPVAVA